MFKFCVKKLNDIFKLIGGKKQHFKLKMHENKVRNPNQHSK